MNKATKTILVLAFLITSQSVFAQITTRPERVLGSVAPKKKDYYSDYLGAYVPYFAFAKAFRSITPSTYQYKDLKNIEQAAINNEIASNKIMYGLYYETSINSTFSFISGIGITNFGEKYQFTTPDNSTQTIDYNYPFLDFPLYLKVKLGQDRFSPYVIGGLSLDLSRDFPTMSLNEGYYSSIYDIPNTELFKTVTDVNEPNVSFFAAAGAQYLIPETDISLFAHLYAKGQLRRLFENYINQRQYQYGLSFGLSLWG